MTDSNSEEAKRELDRNPDNLPETNVRKECSHEKMLEVAELFHCGNCNSSAIGLARLQGIHHAVQEIEKHIKEKENRDSIHCLDICLDETKKRLGM